MKRYLDLGPCYKGFQGVKDWDYYLSAWHGRSRFDKIKRLLAGEKVSYILDIGCGNGFFLKRILPDAKKYGVDIVDAKDIKAFHYVRSNIEVGLPFRSESFDSLIAGEVIEHILDTEYFLEECFRILRSGGFMILTTPNLCSLKNLFLIFQGKQPFGVDFSIGKGTGHIRAFSPQALIFLVKKTGFRIEHICSDRLPLPFASPNSEKMLKIEQIMGDVFKRWGNSFVVKVRK